jgi:hypothetical protein
MVVVSPNASWIACGPSSVHRANRAESSPFCESQHDWLKISVNIRLE